MTLDETIASKIEQLPVSHRRELLNYIDRLVTESRSASTGRRDPRGSLRTPEPLTQEDFDEVRHQAWAGSDA